MIIRAQNVFGYQIRIHKILIWICNKVLQYKIEFAWLNCFVLYFMNLQVMKSYQVINQLVESAVSNDLGHKSILQIITHLMLYVVRWKSCNGYHRNSIFVKHIVSSFSILWIKPFSALYYTVYIVRIMF